MSKRIPTNIKDLNNNMIFVGDTVKKCWGMWKHRGKMTPYCQYHEIKMIQEGNTVRFLLGDCWNIWGDGDVLLCSKPDDIEYGQDVYESL